MCFNVLGQMVASHKPFATFRACKAFLPSVSPQVSLQLVRPSETFATEQPVADEGPLASVPPQVSLQVRRLAVNLPASRDVADVLLLLAWFVVVTRRLAVWAAAPPAPPSSRQGRLGVKESSDLSLILGEV